MKHSATVKGYVSADKNKPKVALGTGIHQLWQPSMQKLTDFDKAPSVHRNSAKAKGLSQAGWLKCRNHIKSCSTHSALKLCLATDTKLNTWNNSHMYVEGIA